MKYRIGLSFLSLLILFLPSIGRTEFTVIKKGNISRWFDPIAIKGKHLKEFLNRNPDQLRLAVFSDNKMLIIPSQFDDIDENGFIVLKNPSASWEMTDMGPNLCNPLL